MNRRWILAHLALACGMLMLGATRLLSGDESLVVHEWGTFTTLQDEAGTELTGINVDDEPVPEFVHNLSPFLLGKPILSHEHWAYRMKAAPRHHPQPPVIVNGLCVPHGGSIGSWETDMVPPNISRGKRLRSRSTRSCSTTWTPWRAGSRLIAVPT